MEHLTLKRAERALCEAVQRGEPAIFKKSESIRAEVIRRILIGLQLDDATSCAATRVGVEIRGATISGRLQLDAITDAGNALCALEFHDCCFVGGFSGAFGKFSRLSFEGCRFRDLGALRRESPVPTLDLSSASIESALDMQRVRPDRDEDHLWIRASGVRIAGKFDLSRARLRAPVVAEAGLTTDPAADALNIVLCEIGGDFQFVGGSRCDGRMNLSGSRIVGDIWMSGATLENPGKDAFIAQSVVVGGGMMLDGRHDRRDETGDFRPFLARGAINLMSAKIDGVLWMVDFAIEAGIEGALVLVGATVGGRATIQSRVLEESTCLGTMVFDDLKVGGDLSVVVRAGIEEENWANQLLAVQARSVSARQVTFGLRPLLRPGASEKDLNPAFRDLSMVLNDLRAEKLVMVGCHLTGVLWARGITCSGDVDIDARVKRYVDLSSCAVGGTLNITNLKLDHESHGLTLSDTHVARSLRLLEPPSASDPKRELLAAREIRLTSLPGTELVETLWRVAGNEEEYRIGQVSFLRRGEQSIVLTGKSNVLHEHVARFGHAVASEAQAEEYLRLFCAYVQGEDGAFWPLMAPDSLPPFLAPDRERTSARVREILESSAELDAEQRAAYQGVADMADLAALDPALFALDSAREPSGAFRLQMGLLYGDSIFRSDFRIVVEERSVLLEMLEDLGVGPILTGMPRFAGMYIHHPSTAPADTQWPVPPSLPGMRDVGEALLPALQARLVPVFRQSFSLNGEIDLRGLVCNTLDDEAGRFWGSHVLIKMDRFVYNRATLLSEASSAQKTPWQWRRRFMLLLAEWAPLWAIRLAGATEKLRAQAQPLSHWGARRNWIFQQFNTRNLPSPIRYPIGTNEYRPQPLEQAIRVARAEGREDFAVRFEILKRNIEWRLFSQRSRPGFMVLGLAALAVWLLLSPTLDWSARIAVGATIFGFAVFASDIAHFVMNYMFGHLRRPVQAIATLIGAFLLGWAGVIVANGRDMLVVDVAPVATLTATRDGPMLVGTQIETDRTRLASNVPCRATIDEALYALDILIPLVDLREESKCSVGAAFTHRDATDPRDPSFSARLERATLDSPTFWGAMKAIYAILGWIIVSLSILTFAHITRSKSDS